VAQSDMAVEISKRAYDLGRKGKHKEALKTYEEAIEKTLLLRRLVWKSVMSSRSWDVSRKPPSRTKKSSS